MIKSVKEIIEEKALQDYTKKDRDKCNAYNHFNLL